MREVQKKTDIKWNEGNKILNTMSLSEDANLDETTDQLNCESHEKF